MTDTLPSLEDRRIMTIVMIAYFKERITNIESVFYILPAEHTLQPMPKRKVKKIKFSYPGKSGTVISVRYKDKVRGTVRALLKKQWRHSVVVDMAEHEKNISFKISPTNLHMCGCKSIDMGIQASKIMIQHINRGREYIKFLQSIPDKSGMLFNKVLKDCVNVKDGEFLFDIKNLHLKETEYQEAFSSLFSDLEYREQAVAKFKWIIQREDFLSNELVYSHFKTGMVKYRFNMNFQCDLQKLVTHFHETDDRFLINYFRGVRNKVVLEFPCLGDPDGESKHTFSVERSGQVTHSCSYLEEIDKVFLIFMGVIRDIRECIIDSD